MIPRSYLVIGLVFGALVIGLIPLTLGVVAIPVALALQIAAPLAAVAAIWKMVLAVGPELWIGVVLTLRVVLAFFEPAMSMFVTPPIEFWLAYYAVVSFITPLVTFLCVVAVWRFADLVGRSMHAVEAGGEMAPRAMLIAAAVMAALIVSLIGALTHSALLAFAFVALVASVGLTIATWRIVLGVSKEVWISLFVALGLGFWAGARLYRLSVGQFGLMFDQWVERHSLIDWLRPVVMALCAAALWRLSGLVKAATMHNKIESVTA